LELDINLEVVVCNYLFNYQRFLSPDTEYCVSKSSFSQYHRIHLFNTKNSENIKYFLLSTPKTPNTTSNLHTSTNEPLLPSTPIPSPLPKLNLPNLLQLSTSLPPNLLLLLPIFYLSRSDLVIIGEGYAEFLLLAQTSEYFRWLLRANFIGSCVLFNEACLFGLFVAEKGEEEGFDEGKHFDSMPCRVN
jgi:hypothetical protein